MAPDRADEPIPGNTQRIPTALALRNRIYARTGKRRRRAMMLSYSGRVPGGALTNDLLERR